MVGSGFLMLILALYALFLNMAESISSRHRAMKVFSWAIVLPYLANTAGWMMTEVGRIPWTVVGLLRLPESVSNTVGSGLITLSLVGYTLIYGALMVATIYLLRKYGKDAPTDSVTQPEEGALPPVQEPSLVPGQD